MINSQPNEDLHGLEEQIWVSLHAERSIRYRQPIISTQLCERGLQTQDVICAIKNPTLIERMKEKYNYIITGKTIDGTKLFVEVFYAPDRSITVLNILGGKP